MSQSKKRHSMMVLSKSAPLLSPKAREHMHNDAGSTTTHNKHRFLGSQLGSQVFEVFKHGAAYLGSFGFGSKSTTPHKLGHDEQGNGKKQADEGDGEIDGYKKVREFSAYRLDVPFGPLNSNPVGLPDFEAIKKTRKFPFPCQSLS
jgi:hypothetical protein